MRATALLVTGLSLAALVACAGGPAPGGPAPDGPGTASDASAPVGAPLPPGGTGAGPDGMRADWVVRENARPGTEAWRITGRPSGTIAGFADRTYASAGDTVTLDVSTDAPRFTVAAYRMGYYGGAGGRLVWGSGELAGHPQPACPLTPGVNLVSCANWSPSLRLPITGDFVPGDYLLKLTGSGGQQSYVPLTVWDPASHASYLIKNDVLTWQAWNPYGGYDYYVGKGACPPGVYPLCSRARVVSFDRPYAFDYNGGQGTGDFLALELPLVRWVEQRGLDVSYATDLTVIDHPALLTAHRAVFSLGHDECWELRERQAAVAAQRAGVNFAFFGASAVLRHVRLQASPLGPDRQEVDYRDSAADPLAGRGNPLEVTGNTWAAPPAHWPEDGFVGEAYNGFLTPDAPPGALRVTEPAAWIYAGTGLADGASVPGVIRSDVDALAPSVGHPPNVEVFAHSPLDAHHAQARNQADGIFYSDMTYYTDPASHSGVWDSGTNNWIPDLAPCAPGKPCPAGPVGAITGNLLRALGAGPAGLTHPAKPNWRPTP
ncbi:MAG TPA: N,N-dimethylformamidase beta subunit family domain-containing protein [Pseudonocardia sp.]|nr:N,N-dimethylformamidase beta subunit family domain-containing protein [Pseudonocardia sp.]